jgi:hypothetical protein
MHHHPILLLQQWGRRFPNLILLDCIPEYLKTPDVWEHAVKKDPNLFRHVPELKKTPKMCEAAVKANPISIAFVPHDLMTTELCLRAMEQKPSVHYFIPDDIKEKVLLSMTTKL